MHRKYDGFTLVEVVVSLLILSLIMLSTLAALRTFANTHTKLQQVTERLDEMRLVTAFLRRSINQAVPVSKIQRGKNKTTYFLGTNKELIWAAPMPGPGAGGLKILRLSNSENNNLTLQVSDYLSAKDEPQWSNSKPHVLIKSLDSIQLAYRSEPQSEWQDKWEAAETSPYAVKMIISAQKRYWPEIIINLSDEPVHTL